MKTEMEFEKLLDKISPRLHAIAYKFNGKYIILNEDDLYQEAVLHLWQEWKDNILEDKTDSYILQGCYYYLKNYLRRTCKKDDIRSLSLNKSINDTAQELEQILACEDSERAFETVDENLLKENIEKQLTLKEKQIFELLFSGFTSREIGAKFGISHVMVIKMKKKIRKKCRGIREELKGRIR